MSNLSVKVFADGANLTDMRSLYRDPLIRGFTTNPTLMRAAGISILQKLTFIGKDLDAYSLEW